MRAHRKQKWGWTMTAPALFVLLAAAPFSTTASAVPEADSETDSGHSGYSTTTTTSASREPRHIGEIGNPQHGQGDDPDFSGVMDFSNAIPGPDGSWCITKTKYIDHMVKDQVKECWHQNITSCHDTYITEFMPSQEQKCEESFWKSCKIDFREMPYNYTMRQCHTPLVKECDTAPTNSYLKPEIVCKTWFEAECNTTFSPTTPGIEDKPNTWCKKVPRKICAPDNCQMVSGPQHCSEKNIVSTVQKPTELCDLQPQQHCRLITKLTPHLISKEVCRKVPKEVCHLALSAPKTVRKPITLKWCTRKKHEHHSAGYKAPNSYLPPPSPKYAPAGPPPSPQYAPAVPPPHSPSPLRRVPSPPPSFPAPQFSASSRRPIQNLRQRAGPHGPQVVADYHATPRKDVIIPVYKAEASELKPVYEAAAFELTPEPAIEAFKADEAVVAAQEREQLEAASTAEAITRSPFEAFAAASKPRTAFEEAAAKLSLPLKKKRFHPPSAKLLAKLKEKKLKKDKEGGQTFASVLQDQIKPSSNAKHVGEPVSIRRIDDNSDEWDTILQEANGGNESDIEREIRTEGEGEKEEVVAVPTVRAIPSAVAAPAVLPASFTDDLGGGGLGFGGEGSMGAFFRRKRR